MTGTDYSRVAAIAEHEICTSGIDIVRRAGIQSWSERHIELHDEAIVARIKGIRAALEYIEAELAKGQTDD